MNLGLANRTAIVAASSQGLGYAVALGLAREGARLAICSRRGEEIEKAADLIRKDTGIEVLARPVDVTDSTQVERFVNDVQSAYGRIDICVTNAGGPPFRTFDHTSLDDWRKAVDLSLLSTVYFAHYVLPIMRRQQWGRFLTVTSVSVLKPIAGLVLSNSIRAAVDGLVKTLSVEYAKDNILINNICPGYTATERLKQAGNLEEIEARLPMGRVATPEEFANLAVFLASERASYISGESIAVSAATRWS
ncbi:MAG: SDR family oxidoreductase [Acidobacteria bacterium]|nr:SDR family oxidoreductase [Acidobacteriota bacterium]